MPSPRDPDPINTQLHETEVRLEQQLGEVCEMREVGGESTGEFIRLEEKLLEAAELAKQAFSLRRRRRLATDPEGTAVPEEHHDELLADAAPRTVVDDDGLVWRVWAVSAARMRANPLSGGQLGAYRDGWLAFESENGQHRRRLPGFPESWSDLSEAELRVLLVRAEPVRSTRPTHKRAPSGEEGERDQGAGPA